MAVVATGSDDRTGTIPLMSATIDEIQDLIGRVEMILDTLQELGDTSYLRLRRKLNKNVHVARDRLMDRVGQPQFGGLGHYRTRRFTATALGIAALSAFVIGFLVAHQRGSNERAPAPASLGARRRDRSRGFRRAIHARAGR